MTTQINLGIATYSGKTWLAELTGLDKKFGFQREFINAAERNTSRSGKTGTASYIVGAGIYESQSGRTGRSYWLVGADDTVTEIDRTRVLAELGG
jgi:hypothetical protein